MMPSTRRIRGREVQVLSRGLATASPSCRSTICDSTEPYDEISTVVELSVDRHMEVNM
jgi:hypothetical protein